MRLLKKSCVLVCLRVTFKFLGSGKTREFQRILGVTVLDLQLTLVACTVGVVDLEGELRKEFYHCLPLRQTWKALKVIDLHKSAAAGTLYVLALLT